PGRSGAQADDGRSASLRGLCGAVDQGWHLRAVRRRGSARGPSAARTSCGAGDAGGVASLCRPSASEDRPMRIGIGGYLVAVNTFATQRMGLELFQRAMLSGDAVLRLGRGESAFAGFMESARQHNWEIVPINFVFPGIMGKVTDDAHAWA